MRQYRFRVARVAAVAVAVAGLALPASAQPPAAQAPAPGPVRQLSMENRHQSGTSEQPEPSGGTHQPRTAGPRHCAGPDGLDAEPDRVDVDLEPDEPDQRVLLGATDKLTSDNVRSNLGANQVLPWAPTTASAGHQPRQVEQRLRQPEPVTVEQPHVQLHAALLRNLKVDSARNQLVISKMNRESRTSNCARGVDDGSEREVRLLGSEGVRRRAAGRPPVPRSRPRGAPQ